MSDLTIRELQEGAHQTAVEHGWWEGERNVGELLMLMVTELAEAMEEWRKGDDYKPIAWGSDFLVNEAGEPVGLGIELADCVIRITDFCQQHGFDLINLLQTKMAYNKTRPYRHGGKRA